MPQAQALQCTSPPLIPIASYHRTDLIVLNAHGNALSSRVTRTPDCSAALCSGRMRERDTERLSADLLKSDDKLCGDKLRLAFARDVDVWRF